MIFYLFLLIFPIQTVFAEDSRQEIVRLLQKWSHDFNEKNIEAACALFAPELIASYPGSPDRNHDEMCETLKKASISNMSYDVPTIEQILIQEDLAVVRLVWTLKTPTETIREKGIDVFKRQKDGSWKIIISYAYPIGQS